MPCERLHAIGVPLDPLLGDDDALHLVGALADAGERRVAIEPLDVVFLGVAVGAVDAHATRCCSPAPPRRRSTSPCRPPCRSARRGRRPAAASSVSRRAARARVAISPSLSWIAWCSQIGLPKVLRIWAYSVASLQRALGDADAARGDVDAAELEPAGRLVEAPALDLADQVVGRNAVVLEDQLGRIDRLVAELLELAADA